MPRCTKCNREITLIENIVTGLVVFNISLDKQGDFQYKQAEFEPDGIVNEYLCPECGESLSTSEPEAIDFLKGV